MSGMSWIICYATHSRFAKQSFEGVSVIHYGEIIDVLFISIYVSSHLRSIYKLTIFDFLLDFVLQSTCESVVTCLGPDIQL